MTEPKKQEVVHIGRLTQEQYEALEREVGVQPYVKQSTSELEAGQIIGIQFVLQKLRAGFVIGRA